MISKRTRNGLLLFTTALTIAASSCELPFSPGYYNFTSSAPKGFYHRVSVNGPLQRGQYVVIAVPEAAAPIVYGRGWGQPGTPLLKRVGAVEGDEVRISDDGLYINQTYCGPVYISDRQGLPLPRLRGTFTIAPGEFLPVSPHERSFDGRYFGPVSIHAIESRVDALLTF